MRTSRISVASRSRVTRPLVERRAIEQIAVERATAPCGAASRTRRRRSRAGSSRCRSISPIGELRHEREVPVDREHGDGRWTQAPAAARRTADAAAPRVRSPARSSARRTALAERAGHRPRFDAAADVDLQRDHQQQARAPTRTDRRCWRPSAYRDTATGPARRARAIPSKRQRRPHEEAVLR